MIEGAEKIITFLQICLEYRWGYNQGDESDQDSGFFQRQSQTLKSQATLL